MNNAASPNAAIEKVGLCVKPNSPAAGAAAAELYTWLRARGLEVWVDLEAASFCKAEGHEREALAEKADLMLVLGGDGTLLSVARQVGERAVPILGVNLGNLGFLAELSRDEQTTVLEDVLAGRYRTRPRMRLSVRALRGEATLLEALALNDAVINRSDLSRLIDLETRADGVPVTRYHGDGLIVATPTGSTAYTLSAGGPILMPGSRVFALTPICAHALSQRPLVLPEDTRLEIVVRLAEGNGRLTVDGQVAVALEDGDVVTVSADAPPASFVDVPGRSRFEVLRTKLGWGKQ